MNRTQKVLYDYLTQMKDVNIYEDDYKLALTTYVASRDICMSVMVDFNREYVMTSDFLIELEDRLSQDYLMACLGMGPDTEAREMILELALDMAQNKNVDDTLFQAQLAQELHRLSLNQSAADFYYEVMVSEEFKNYFPSGAAFMHALYRTLKG